MYLDKLTHADQSLQKVDCVKKKSLQKVDFSVATCDKISCRRNPS